MVLAYFFHPMFEDCVFATIWWICAVQVSLFVLSLGLKITLLTL